MNEKTAKKIRKALHDMGHDVQEREYRVIKYERTKWIWTADGKLIEVPVTKVTQRLDPVCGRALYKEAKRIVSPVVLP